MMRFAGPSRRGAALLMVLAAVLLVTVATVAFALAAAARREHERAAAATRMADDLLHASAGPIHRWLRESSGSIVLSPECVEPAVRVLHDRWTAAGMEHDLSITAWDQCGMPPIESRPGAQPGTQQIAQRVAQPRAAAADRAANGLDAFVTIHADPRGSSPFPRAMAGGPMEFGEGAGEITGSAIAAAPRAEGTADRALGAVAATHNPPPGRVNVNTAPRPLLEDALRRAGRGGLEWIVQSRRVGRAVSIASLPAGGVAGGRAGAGSPAIVSSSNAWAVRIDIRVGPVRRSWWSVYMQPRGRQWECVQRLAITD